MNKKSKTWIDEEVKKWDLDDEEREVLESYERGDWKPLPKKEFEAMKKGLQRAAHNTLERMKKSESVSIRFAPNVLQAIKARAAEEGIPYQTLISSLAYKYVSGKKIA